MEVARYPVLHISPLKAFEEIRFSLCLPGNEASMLIAPRGVGVERHPTVAREKLEVKPGKVSFNDGPRSLEDSARFRNRPLGIEIRYR